MSRKTENILKLLDELDDIQNQISIINQLAKSQGMIDEEAEAQKRHHLEEIEFEMKQNLKSLRFWINSLYAYNGKSKSKAKTDASKKNGAKGGRPPKQITDSKKRMNELENETIPLLEKKRLVTLDPASEAKLDEEIFEAKKEYSELEEKVRAWETEKSLRNVMSD